MPLPDLRAMNDRINALDHEAILEARQNPSDHRGRIEALLAGPGPEFRSTGSDGRDRRRGSGVVRTLRTPMWRGAELRQ